MLSASVYRLAALHGLADRMTSIRGLLGIVLLHLFLVTPVLVVGCQNIPLINDQDAIAREMLKVQ